MLCCVVLLFSNLANAESIGSREAPYGFECSNCYTDLDFKNFAQAKVPSNQSFYYLIYNLETQTLRTVFTFHNIEPELGMNIKKSFIISTLASHQAEFNNALNDIAIGKAKKEATFNYPETGGEYHGCCFVKGSGATADYARYIRGELQKKTFLYAAMTWTVKLKFANGDTAYIFILPRSDVAELIIALNSTDKVITQTQGGGGNGSTSGDTVNYGSTWTISSGSAITFSCYFDGDRTLTCKKN